MVTVLTLLGVGWFVPFVAVTLAGVVERRLRAVQ
jgi:hypothetical protein